MIEIITTSFFVFSSIYGGTSIADNPGTSSTGTPIVMAPIEENSKINIPNNKGLEKKVREYFKNDPLLAEIAGCESHFRQFDKEGNVLRGKVNKSDVGLLQINEYYHGDKAKSMGIDIYTVEGNLAYAKYLYENQGGQPWKSSSPCWNDGIAEASTSTELAVNM